MGGAPYNSLDGWAGHYADRDWFSLADAWLIWRGPQTAFSVVDAWLIWRAEEDIVQAWRDKEQRRKERRAFRSQRREDE